jgi:hypothetical protein
MRPLLAVCGLLLAVGCAATTTEGPPGTERPETSAPRPTAPETAVPTVPATLAPTAEATACAEPAGCFGQPRRVGTFDVEVVPGASGLAASRRNPDVLYLLDDRPGTGEIWAVTTDGTMLGAIEVPGLDALDTESLTIGPCAAGDDVPCLYVGDIGDNLRSRTDITVHRFPEPDLSGGQPGAAEGVEVIRLSYPGGPEDAEALLVDDDGTPYVVTKAPFDTAARTTGTARLLGAPGFASGVMVDLGEVPVPAPDAPLQSQVVGNVVTGGDQRPGQVILRTYDQVLAYTAPEAGAALGDFPSWEVSSLPAPFELQPEAVTWAADGCGFYSVGEQSGDIWHVPCRPE